MKKTMKNLLPLALLILIPYLSGNNVKAENNNSGCKRMALNDRNSSVLKTTPGKMIVRNIIRK